MRPGLCELIFLNPSFYPYLIIAARYGVSILQKI